MDRIPDAERYNSFAYHTALLSDFNRGDWVGNNAASLSASLGRRGRRGGSLTTKRGGSLRGRANSIFAVNTTRQMTGSNRSSSSMRSFRVGGSLRGSRGRGSTGGGAGLFAAYAKGAKGVVDRPPVTRSSSSASLR